MGKANIKTLKKELDKIINIHYVTKYNSPIGQLTLISEGEYLTNLYIEGQIYYLDNRIKYLKKDNLEIFIQTKKWLNMYFEGNIPNIKLKIKLKGTPFQEEVWHILTTIPYGKIITYKDIANKIAKKKNIKIMSSQAVGRAVGNNPISIIIPCHRVIGTNGKLTGYNGGINLKRRLLNIENMHIDK